MNGQPHHLVLGGAQPEPLASYLKALGVLRAVNLQLDPSARAWWDRDGLHLSVGVDAEALLDFFCKEWAPTPIVAPWNGGSGFHPKDNTEGIKAISASSDARFGPYRDTIRTCQQVLEKLGLVGKPDGEQKGLLLEQLRGELSDAALAWFDAAVVLTADGPRFPPLLGTGGNDGRLEFTNNLMQRLVGLLIEGKPAETRTSLRGALFGEAVPRLVRGAIGQFAPGSAGGANAGPGFDRDALINPWDFVLMLEGALVFGAAATRRLESMAPGQLAYPFSVRAAGVGYGSAAEADENPRGEIWLPMWGAPAGIGEVQALFSEGRARVSRRSAGNAVDFARAVASLGVDRGIAAFTRYGFQVRNGLSYFATPLGRWRVRSNPEVSLLDEIDPWLERLRRAVSDAPAAVSRAARQLDEAVLRWCAGGGAAQVQAVLITLAEVEQVLARSRRFTEDKFLGPVPLLRGGWAHAADDRSPVFGLARALAADGLRRHRVPVLGGRWSWESDRQVVWADRGLEENLIAMLQRQDQNDEDPRSGRATLREVVWFQKHPEADLRLGALAAGLSLVDPEALGATPTVTERGTPPLLYGVLSLARWGRYLQPGESRDELRPPARTPGMLSQAAAGNARVSSTLALRRLRSLGFVLPMDTLAEPPSVTRRVAASLAFPLTHTSRQQLIEQLSQPVEDNHAASDP